MKFAPTSLFTSLVTGGSKYLQWKVYIKKTTDLSEALTAGTWVEVTDRLEIPTIGMAVEASAGSSSSDKISLVGSGIVWWQAQVFNATSSQYIEVKVTCQLGLSETKLATDLCYEFYGYAEKKYTIQETSDTVTFDVYTADDLLGRIPAERISKQVLADDLDGAGLQGLYLQTVPGIFVTNANVTSYILHQGVHELAYGIRDGSPQLSLDGGESISPSAGINTLSNEDDTQRVEVYCIPSQLLNSGDVKTEIIVMTSGQTLPWTWPSGIRVKDILAQIYSLIGLNTFTFDEWDLDTFDGRRVASFFEVPPSGSYYGRTGCITYDNAGGVLYLGVKDSLYTRNMSSHSYSLVATPSSGWWIKKIFTEEVGSGYLWLWLESGGAYKVCRVTIAGGACSLTSVTAAYDQAVAYCSGDLLYYVKNPLTKRIKKFHLATQTESDLKGSDWSTIDYVFDGSGGCSDGTNYYAVGYETAVPHRSVLVEFNSGGDTILHNFGDYPTEMGCYGNHIVFSFIGSDGINDYAIPTDILTTGLATGELICPITVSTSVHFIRRVLRTDDSGLFDYYLAKWTGASVVSETDTINFATDSYDTGQLMAYDSAHNKNLFVTNVCSMLGQFYTKVSVFLSPEISFSGETLRGALNSILESYMMLGKISPDKTVKVYRKFDSVGTVKTSGSAFAITINDAEEILKQVAYSEAVKWLEVSNGEVSHSYDGTHWDEKIFTADRKVTVSSKLIPSNIVKDVCYYLWLFFSVDHHLYEIPLANVTPLHLEAFDGLAVTFTGNRVTESGTLVIYGLSVEQDGYMKVKGLK
jgi:hypothetical protein